MNRDEDERAVNRKGMYEVAYSSSKMLVLVCFERAGPTPSHPEPGRETAQRRGYWGDDSLGEQVNAPGPDRRGGEEMEQSVASLPTHRGVEQWQLVGLITRRSVVRIHPPLPVDTA